MINSLEFYIFEDELWYISQDGSIEKVKETDRDIIKSILEYVREFYPDAYKALSCCYKKSAANVPYYQFLMVSRFCKCNFGNLDSTNKDIDSNGRLVFEKITCPLRGECPYEGVICSPRFNSKLSDAELRVMKMLYDGYDVEKIADALYLSPHTVKNHIKASYMKLGIHEKSAFIRYAKDNNMFN